MPIFISVRKLVLLVCIKSALIMSFPVRTINKIPLNYCKSCILEYTGTITVCIWSVESMVGLFRKSGMLQCLAMHKIITRCFFVNWP